MNLPLHFRQHRPTTEQAVRVSGVRFPFVNSFMKNASFMIPMRYKSSRCLRPLLMTE
jgi:hypothetical protein